MHIMRSMQLACAQASPNRLAKAVLCLESRASIWTRAYHPNMLDLPIPCFDSLPRSRYQDATNPSLRLDGCDLLAT